MAPTNGKSNGHEALAAAAARGDWGAFFKSYKLTDALSSLSLSKRAAHALDWTATRAPGVVVPYNVVLKVVMGYSHTPRLGNEEVERFRSGALGDARRHLRSQYRRDLKSVSGVGVRATVDGLDVVKSTLPASVQKGSLLT